MKFKNKNIAKYTYIDDNAKVYKDCANTNRIFDCIMKMHEFMHRKISNDI